MTWLKGEFIVKVTTRPDHKCAAPKCRKMIPATVVMCRPHWLRVPDEFRNRVNFYYRPSKSEQFQEFHVALNRAIAEMRKSC